MRGKKSKNTKLANDAIDFEIDQYDGGLYDLDRNEVFYSEEVNEEPEEEDYTDFNRINEYDSTEDDLYDKSLQEAKEESVSKTRKKKTTEDDFYDSDLFYTVSKWVKIIGIFLIIVCIAYYLSIGDIKALLIYIMLLAIAYFCGYGFMYLMTNSSK